MYMLLIIDLVLYFYNRIENKLGISALPFELEHKIKLLEDTTSSNSSESEDLEDLLSNF